MIGSLRIWSFAFGLVFSLHAGGSDPDLRILHAELSRSDLGYVLNADIDVVLSEPVVEAITNGVPITLVAHLKIQRPRRYWWDKTVLDDRWTLVIRYHPLSKLFQVSDSASGNQPSYASLTAMLEALGTIRGWRLPALAELPTGQAQAYEASFSIHLDIESLPLPLRPIAYTSPSWHLKSDWYQWRVGN